MELKQIKRVILTMLCILGIACGYSQAMAAPAEIREFSFNRAVAVVHGQAAIEDFGTLMMKERPLSAVNFTKPYVAAILGRDCDNKEINVVLVAFPDAKSSGWAFSHWERNRDGLITRLLSVGFSIEALDSLVNKARAGGAMCE